MRNLLQVVPPLQINGRPFCAGSRWPTIASNFRTNAFCTEIDRWPTVIFSTVQCHGIHLLVPGLFVPVGFFVQRHQTQSTIPTSLLNCFCGYHFYSLTCKCKYICWCAWNMGIMSYLSLYVFGRFYASSENLQKFRDMCCTPSISSQMWKLWVVLNLLLDRMRDGLLLGLEKER